MIDCWRKLARRRSQWRRIREETAVTETPLVSDKAKTVAEPEARNGDRDVWPPPERHGTSVYADYWRERSGFFSAIPKVDDRARRFAKTD